MAGWIGLGAGVKALVLGGAAAAAVAGGVAFWQKGTVPDLPAAEATAPTQVAAAPATAPVPEVVPTAPAALGPEPPSFDVVRVEPDGATLVAGRAGAGHEVAVLVDGAEAAVAKADPQGRFVVFLTLASSTSARIMTLELRPAGRAVVPSEDQVLLAPGTAATPEAEVEAPAAEPVAKAPAAAPPAEAEALVQAEPQAIRPEVAEPAPAPIAEAADALAEEPAVAASTVVEPQPRVAAVPVTEPAPQAAAATGAKPAPDLPVAAAEPAPAAASEPAPAGVAEQPVAPAAGPVPEVLATAEPPADLAPKAAPLLPQGTPEPVLATAEPVPDPGHAAAEAAAVAAAPTALLVSGNSVKVLQSSGSADAGPSSTVSIDAISYTVGGAVALSGRGAAQAFVRLYLDNRPLLETAVAEDGTWGGTLPAVAPGIYTLRADQVSAAGQVTSRYETPFQREDPVALSAAAPAAAAQAGLAPETAPPGRVSITVQPGFTLWQIARENYGDGTLFVRVYDANKTLIRDPDLIYPGQVFSVPTGN